MYTIKTTSRTLNYKYATKNALKKAHKSSIKSYYQKIYKNNNIPKLPCLYLISLCTLAKINTFGYTCSILFLCFHIKLFNLHFVQ